MSWSLEDLQELIKRLRTRDDWRYDLRLSKETQYEKDVLKLCDMAEELAELAERNRL